MATDSQASLMPSGFAHEFGPWAIVAGASEGLGAAFAVALASRGLNLVIIARRETELRALADRLTEAYHVIVRPLVLDVSSETARAKVSLEIADLDIGLLVYNACASRIGEFLESPPEAFDAILACNCRGLVHMTHLISHRLVARQRGGLLLMSSMSGFHGHALCAAYAASKAFTTVLGEGLWAELEPKGVTVRVCAAGATTTPNFLSATPAATRKLTMPMSPESVVETALRAMQRRSGGPVIIPGFLNRCAELLMRRVLSPSGAVRFMSSNLRRVYNTRSPLKSPAFIPKQA